MPNPTFQNVAKFLVFGALTIFLSACNTKDTATAVSKFKTLYPIYTHDCQTISKEKQYAFLKKLSRLKQGMTSDKVVEILGFQPTFYRQNDDKRLNALIQYYHMDYSFDCADVLGNAFIWLRYSTDEKLLEVKVGKNVHIDKIDSSLIFSKFQN